MPSERFSTTPVLETGRLLLRGLEDGDVDALYEVNADPQVARYLPRPAMRAREEAVAMLERCRRYVAEGTGLTWGVALKPEGRVIGTVVLFDFNEQCAYAQTGYVLGRAHWGRGLMHEAMTRLVEHAFGAMDLRRLEADVDPRNLASLRVVERLGFVREGLLRERWVVEGEISDSVVLGLLRREWAARTSQAR